VLILVAAVRRQISGLNPAILGSEPMLEAGQLHRSPP
jgi:hypothetical protein